MQGRREEEPGLHTWTCPKCSDHGPVRHLLCHGGVGGQRDLVLHQPHAHGPWASQLLPAGLEGESLQLEVPFRGGLHSPAGQLQPPGRAAGGRQEREPQCPLPTGLQGREGQDQVARRPQGRRTCQGPGFEPCTPTKHSGEGAQRLGGTQEWATRAGHRVDGARRPRGWTSPAVQGRRQVRCGESDPLKGQSSGWEESPGLRMEARG